MWPPVVEGYTMFHSDRAVARPVANQSCGKNRENRQRAYLPHSFFLGGGGGQIDVLAKLLLSLKFFFLPFFSEN